MIEKLKQTIEEEVGKLQKETQKAINSLDWAKLTEEIGRKYLLSDDEVNDLQVETLLILVGIENGNDYVKNIENQVGTTKEEAGKIAEEVAEKVFTPIEDILIENIKESEKSKNPSAEKSISFILSGGDYSTLLDEPAPVDIEEAGERVLPEFSIKEENLKEKFNINPVVE